MQATSSSVSLSLHLVNGPVFRMQVSSTDSIAAVKRHIEDQFNLSAASQRLIYRGKQLADDSSCIGDYLPPGGGEMRLHLITGRVAQQLQVSVHILFHKTLSLSLSPRDTVGTLKRLVEAREGIAAERQKVVLRGRQVGGYVSVEHLNLSPADKIYVLVKEDQGEVE